MRDLAGGSDRARVAAAQALGDLEDPTERRRALVALTRALDDDLPQVRAEACGSLGTLGDPSVIPAIVKRLDDGTPLVRQHAAIALGAIGDDDGFEPLATALKEGPADLRFQAASSIAEIDAHRAVDPLIAALDDRDPQVVGAAALALGAIGAGHEDIDSDRYVDLIAERLDHRDPVTRFDVAYALADLGDPRGRPLLITALADEQRSWDAVTALAQLGSKQDITALASCLGDKRTPPEATVLAAGKLIALSPDTEYAAIARQVLLVALGAKKVNVRGLAVEQLGECGGVWARGALEKLAESSKGKELVDAIGEALDKISERPDTDRP